MSSFDSTMHPRQPAGSGKCGGQFTKSVHGEAPVALDQTSTGPRYGVLHLRDEQDALAHGYEASDRGFVLETDGEYSSLHATLASAVAEVSVAHLVPHTPHREGDGWLVTADVDGYTPARDCRADQIQAGDVVQDPYGTVQVRSVHTNGHVVFTRSMTGVPGQRMVDEPVRVSPPQAWLVDALAACRPLNCSY